MSPLKPRALRERFLVTGLLFGLASLSAFACQSFRDEPSNIHSSQTVERLPMPASYERDLQMACASGERFGELAAALAQDQREAGNLCAAAVPVLEQILTNAALGDETAQRAMALFQRCPSAAAPRIFANLADRPEGAVRDLAWQLARAQPSPAMAKQLGLRVSSALGKPNLGGLATTSVAAALSANMVPGSYTFLRQALAASGRPEFLSAMLALDPEHARDDALSYLAKATFEELNTGKLQHVDPRVCKEVLTFFAAHAPSLNHPNFGHLFLYAVAADPGLSSRATAVLTKVAESNSPALASTFTKMARDVQLAYAVKLHAAATAEAVTSMQDLKREIRARVTDVEVLAALDQI